MQHLLQTLTMLPWTLKCRGSSHIIAVDCIIWFGWLYLIENGIQVALLWTHIYNKDYLIGMHYFLQWRHCFFGGYRYAINWELLVDFIFIRHAKPSKSLTSHIDPCFSDFWWSPLIMSATILCTIKALHTPHHSSHVSPMIWYVCTNYFSSVPTFFFMKTTMSSCVLLFSPTSDPEISDRPPFIMEFW